MRRFFFRTGWILIALGTFGCTSSQLERDRELSSSRSGTPASTATPPSIERQQSGIARPPVVLHSGAETAEYSYATGCYQAYESICGKLLTDPQKGACRQDGLNVCEKYGHEFGEWIRSGAGAVRK